VLSEARLRDRLVDLTIEVDEVANRLHHAGRVDASRLVHVQARALAKCCRRIGGGEATRALAAFFSDKDQADD